MTKELQEWLKLPNLKPTPYTIQIENETTIKSVELIKDFKIQIHKILYIATFMVMKKNVLDSTYSILLSQP
jgi:hypothetical protein